MTTMNDEKWTELQQAEDMAYFKADICLYSPESYTLDEKKEICNDMVSTSKAVLDAMRADFEQLPADARSKLLDMLCQSGVESPEWWWDVQRRLGHSSATLTLNLYAHALPEMDEKAADCIGNLLSSEPEANNVRQELRQKMA